jgi:hypothetical protein
MSNSRQSSMGRTALRIVMLLMTLAGFIFFVRFWLLFLPVNVLGKMNPIFNWLSQFLPNPIMAICYFLLLIVIFGGGVYTLTRLYYLTAKKILSRSLPAFTAFAVITILLGILLWPVPCDTHESFIDIPNMQCDCAGWSFEFYPPFVMDGSSTVFCMGWEIPVEQIP